MSDDRELLLLTKQADGLDQEREAQYSEGQGVGGGGEHMPPPSTADELRGLIHFSVNVLSPLWPTLREVYGTETVDALAEAGGPVLEKYGLSVSGLFGRWEAEIALAMVVIPVGISTVRAVRHDNEQALKRQQQGGKNEGAKPVE